MRLKAVAREEGSDYLTWNDIQACVDQVNLTIQEEHEREWTAHLYAHVQTCTQTHVRTLAGTHMHILARMHVHTHTDIHRHTQQNSTSKTWNPKIGLKETTDNESLHLIYFAFQDHLTSVFLHMFESLRHSHRNVHESSSIFIMSSSVTLAVP